jgi:creatinine amidohydrolase
MTSDPLSDFRYEFLGLPKLRKILATAPIAIIPIGILEWHGDHNALGMDGLMAEELCRRVMVELHHGVLFPIHWVGTYGYVHYEGTVCYEEEVTTRYLTQLLEQVVKLGFKLIFLISGHGGKWQEKAIHTAVQSVLNEPKQPKEIRILGVVYPDLAQGIKVTHAGLEETAMLWRVGEIKGVSLVDMAHVSPTPETLSLYHLAHEERVTIHEETLWNWDKIFPHTEQCSPALGEQLLASIAAGILEELKIYCEEMHINIDLE